MDTIYIHLILIFIFMILILLKCGSESNITFLTYLFLLISQLSLLYFELERKRNEQFNENGGDVKIQEFNKNFLWKLVDLPKRISQPISSGLDVMLESTTGKSEYSNIYQNMHQYKDANLRKQYKHIDYVLEKIKVLDKNIYNQIVPNYTNEDYEKNSSEMDKMEE